MKLRKLNANDASLMLEWMHDQSVVENLQTNFAEKTMGDCVRFIFAAQETSESMHLAIASNTDEYMGTVSLKHIKNDEAEFGITIRKAAMGKGYSIFAMNEMLRIAFEQLKLKRVFWCVNPMNARAVRFYDKNSFKRVQIKGMEVEGYTRQQVDSYIWYEVKSIQ